MEVLFLALDREEDQRKLLSLELTGAWLNEAREIPKAILDALTGRVGRYPGKILGGCDWSGIVMDTNPPDDQSWWYRMAEEETPDEYEFFEQPSGRSADAENIPNLPKDYYKRIVAGKDPDWVKVYVDGEYGFVVEGKPVFPSFRDRIHVAPESFQPNPVSPILIGADFGLTPAAALGQRLPDGRWIIFDEFVTDNCGITVFAELLSAYIGEHYPDFEVPDTNGCFGDPSGTTRSQLDERTAIDIMTAVTPWKWKPAPGDNTLTMRLEAVIVSLNRLVDGTPGLMISPKCTRLRKAMNGGYHYRAVKTSNGASFQDQPNKNQFSHIAEALQYLLLGGGEHKVVLRRARARKPSAGPTIAQGLDYDVFGHGSGAKGKDFKLF